MKIRIVHIMFCLCSVLFVANTVSAQIGYNAGQYPVTNAMPSATFQSTGSAMMKSGSVYAAEPVLNADGTASYNGASYAPANNHSGGQVRKAGAFDDDDDDMPLGDAVLPLLLMALAFMVYVALRRKKKEDTH